MILQPTVNVECSVDFVCVVKTVSEHMHEFKIKLANGCVNRLADDKN